MAFPTVVGSPTVTPFGSGASHPANMPSVVVAGRILLAHVVNDDGNDTVTTPDGWTLIDSTPDGSAEVRAGWYKRLADGSEGGTTVNFATATSEDMVVTVFQIDGHDGIDNISISTAVTATTASPNPGSVTFGWTGDTLVIASVGSDDDDLATAYPTNYGNGITNATDSTGGVTASLATRNVTGSSEDPGAFTLAGSEQTVSHTIAIKGGASGAAARAAYYRRRRAA